MSISLYDISIATYLQTLGGVAGFLDKGASYCAENGIDPDQIVTTTLRDDMLPFRFQIISVAHHSLGTIHAIESGSFSPPSGFDDNADYAGLQALINERLEALKAYTPETINAMADRDVIFKLGNVEMPFTASNFVLSFSHPNVYFHAATAYDILRMKGVPIGKRDFMGMPRMKGAG